MSDLVSSLITLFILILIALSALLKKAAQKQQRASRPPARPSGEPRTPWEEVKQFLEEVNRQRTAQPRQVRRPTPEETAEPRVVAIGKPARPPTPAERPAPKVKKKPAPVRLEEERPLPSVGRPSLSELQKAIVMREVLGPAVSMRPRMPYQHRA